MDERQEQLSPAELEEVIRQRRRREHLEEKAAATQGRLGVVSAIGGLGMSGWVVYQPNLLGAVLAAGIFVVGIGLAVPAARPWIMRVLEALPWIDTTPPAE